MRSRLLLPTETLSVHLQLLASPFINKSLQLGTFELLPKNNTQNSICILALSRSASSFSQFTPFIYETSLFPSQFPPSSPSLFTLLQLQQSQTTLLCVNISGKECARLHWENFFLYLQHSFGAVAGFFRVWERRGDPHAAVIWLNKQPGPEPYILQRTPGDSRD